MCYYHEQNQNEDQELTEHGLDTQPAAAPLLGRGQMLQPGGGEGGSPASGIFNISKKKGDIMLIRCLINPTRHQLCLEFICF